MIFKRRMITLLELLIAMGLAAALISSALFFYRYVATANNELYLKEKKAFEERLIQLRLNLLFQHVEIYKNKPIIFFTKAESINTKGPGLVLRVKNPPFDIPTFAGSVIQFLFVDNEKRLSIATWNFNQIANRDAPPEMHLEVLAEGVERIDFQFLVAEEQSSYPELKAGMWLKEWLPGYESIPIAVKVILTKEKQVELVSLVTCDRRGS